MPVKYELLQDCRYGRKGDIITAAAPSRLADLNKGMGRLFVEPKQVKPKVEVEVKVEEKPKPMFEVKPIIKVEKKEEKKVETPKPKTAKSAKQKSNKK